MRLILSGAARDDFRAIDVWLRREASPDVAARMLTQIRRRTRFLLDFPHAGRPVPEHDFRILRAIPTSFLIVYRLTDTHVELLRVRHEREDWQMEL